MIVSTSGPIHLHVAGKTDVGLVREHNEDNFTVVDLAKEGALPVEEMQQVELTERGAVLLVCDGMGGAAAGEIASAMAVETVRESMQKAVIPPNLDGEQRKASFARRLRSAAFTANEKIFEAARIDPDKIGMGTTMTAVGVIDNHLVMAQVGDSRAYLLRDGVLTQLTRDQSLVNELLESGQITEEQAVMFEHSNVILQALGVQQDVDVLLSTIELRKGDRIVVCSDGLTGVVADEEVGALAYVSDDVADSCRLLIDVARGAGGPDNITAIVARFDGDGLVDPSEKDPVIAYTRWRLDEPTPSATTAQKSATQRAIPQIAPVPADSFEPSRRPDFARTFFSAMLLFALAMASLIVASTLHRGDGAASCTVTAAPGLRIRIDGFETGARTEVGSTQLHLPSGRHRIRLQGPGAPAGEQAVEVGTGLCAARFDANLP